MSGPQTQCPPDSALMKAWNVYEETDDFKNSLYWATTDTIMRQERAEEHGIDHDANQCNPMQREQHVKGSLWASFVAGFGAAGRKASF